MAFKFFIGKVVLITGLIIYSIAAACQPIKFISKYYLPASTDTGVDNFKIRGHIYTLNTNRTFLKDGQPMLTWPVDSSITLEVYKGRYLIVSYYPSNDRYLSFGAEVMLKRAVVIHALKEPAKKWKFDLLGKYRSLDIAGFDPGKGQLIIKEKNTAATTILRSGN